MLVAVARYGSVTAAAQALNYAQPSISHHMARLEAETGAKLMERSGRGIRLTDAGQLLAERAQEILARLDAAEAELAAHVGLRCDQLRVAAFGSALGTLVPAACAAVRGGRPDLAISIIQAWPDDAVRMLRTGAADVALTFRYADQPARQALQGEGCADVRDDDVLYRLVLDEPVFLVTRERPAGPGTGTGRALPGGLGALADQPWIAGCPLCEEALMRLGAQAGFVPRVTTRAGDFAAAQAMVAGGLGVTILPELALRAVRLPGIEVTELPGLRRQIYTAGFRSRADRTVEAEFVAALTAEPDG